VKEQLARVEEAIGKSKLKADKEKLMGLKQNLVEKGKGIAACFLKLKKMISDKLSPPPEIVDVDTKVNKEVINEDLKPNQIRIRLTGSDRLRAADASYVKYHF
jgi:hypothetical protein